MQACHVHLSAQKNAHAPFQYYPVVINIYEPVMALNEEVVPSLGSTSMDNSNPSYEMKAEMRMAVKPPSEWLYLLCPGWAAQNAEIAAATDARLMSYKPYLGGQLSSQLLCRLSIFGKDTFDYPWMEGNSPPSFDFWKVLGVEDDFDRAHIVANIERFCSVYNICGGNPNVSSIAAPFSQGSDGAMHSVVDIQHRRSKSKCAVKEREKEAFALRKAAEKAARAASREEKRQQKIEIKRQRAEMAKMQREVAFKNLAELVQSARVPAEIIGGVDSTAAAPKTAPALAVPAAAMRKNRSSIVISTAADLDQIVTYSNCLWEKYNAAAKEHNKRVKWIMVAKELGINVKVREKYARMHARAKMRGFDFVNWGHYRIKDYPQYFLDPVSPPPLASLPTDGNGNHSNPGQETHASADATNDVGDAFSDSTYETDQALINLAMEVAEAGGYSSDPAPEYMSAMEANAGYGMYSPPFSFGNHYGV